MSKYNLPKLGTKAISSVLNKFERKASAKCTVRVGKGFTSFLLNGDKDDIINIVESLEKSSFLIDGATETVKHQIKKQQGGFIVAVMSYGCFIDTIYNFFINATCRFFIDKFSNWKLTIRWIFTIIRFNLNDESSSKRIYIGQEKIQKG